MAKKSTKKVIRNHDKLTPFKAGEERTRLMAIKGGSVCSKNKSIARRLDRLREKGMNDDTARRLFDILTDADYSNFDGLTWLEKCRANAKTNEESLKVLKVKNEWHKLAHGTKEQRNNININVNMMDDTEKESIILELEEDEE